MQCAGCGSASGRPQLRARPRTEAQTPCRACVCWAIRVFNAGERYATLSCARLQHRALGKPAVSYLQRAQSCMNTMPAERLLAARMKSKVLRRQVLVLSAPQPLAVHTKRFGLALCEVTMAGVAAQTVQHAHVTPCCWRRLLVAGAHVAAITHHRARSEGIEASNDPRVIT